MKFVFFVHSFITYYVSIGVIKKNRYSAKDCIFLLHRNFAPSRIITDAAYVIFPFEFHPLDYFPLYLKFWKGQKKLKELDHFLEKKVGNVDFHFFTPQSRAKVFQLIINNNNCRGYSYIEEGMLSYWELSEVNKLFPPNRKTKKERILSFLNYNNRLLSKNSYYHLNYCNVYGVNNVSFPNYSKRVQVDFDLNNVQYSYENVFVFDALVEFHLIKLDTFYLTLIHFVLWIKAKKIEKIHFKFHPAQYQSTESVNNLRKFFELFKNDVNFIELPPDSDLEEISFNSNANFFVFRSSLGIYASLAGRKVYSLTEIVKDIDPSFKFSKESLPSVFRDNVTFLTLE